MEVISDIAGYFGGLLATSISSYVDHAISEKQDMVVPD